MTAAQLMETIVLRAGGRVLNMVDEEFGGRRFVDVDVPPEALPKLLGQVAAP